MCNCDIGQSRLSQRSCCLFGLSECRNDLPTSSVVIMTLPPVSVNNCCNDVLTCSLVDDCCNGVLTCSVVTDCRNDVLVQ
jgi:hypothetical protein